jgi:hypothetical protein
LGIEPKTSPKTFFFRFDGSGGDRTDDREVVSEVLGIEPKTSPKTFFFRFDGSGGERTDDREVVIEVDIFSFPSPRVFGDRTQDLAGFFFDSNQRP